MSNPGSPVQFRLLAGQDFLVANSKIQGKSDPYCELYLRRTKEHASSSRLNNTVNPTWHQSYDVFDLYFWDANLINNSIPLGQCSVPAYVALGVSDAVFRSSPKHAQVVAALRAMSPSQSPPSVMPPVAISSSYPLAMPEPAGLLHVASAYTQVSPSTPQPAQQVFVYEGPVAYSSLSSSSLPSYPSSPVTTIRPPSKSMDAIQPRKTHIRSRQYSMPGILHVSTEAHVAEQLSTPASVHSVSKVQNAGAAAAAFPKYRRMDIHSGGQHLPRSAPVLPDVPPHIQSQSKPHQYQQPELQQQSSAGQRLEEEPSTPEPDALEGPNSCVPPPRQGIARVGSTVSTTSIPCGGSDLCSMGSGGLGGPVPSPPPDVGVRNEAPARTDTAIEVALGVHALSMVRAMGRSYALNTQGYVWVAVTDSRVPDLSVVFRRNKYKKFVYHKYSEKVVKPLRETAKVTERVLKKALKIAKPIASVLKPLVNVGKEFPTWKIDMFHIRKIFQGRRQSWNRDYPSAVTIFTTPGVRDLVMAQHATLYGGAGIASAVSNMRSSWAAETGVVFGGDAFLSLINYGIRDNISRLFTYVLKQDKLYFAETGADFFHDYNSKHAMHANGEEEVVYAGEFHVRIDYKNGDAQHPVYTLVLDNNSGTYAPDKSCLPLLRDVFLLNFLNLNVEVRDFQDPVLKEYVSTLAMRPHSADSSQGGG